VKLVKNVNFGPYPKPANSGLGPSPGFCCMLNLGSSCENQCWARKCRGTNSPTIQSRNHAEILLLSTDNTLCFKISHYAGGWWLMPVILATQETEIRRIGSKPALGK
jgi:hypothetical protein